MNQHNNKPGKDATTKSECSGKIFEFLKESGEWHTLNEIVGKVYKTVPLLTLRRRMTHLRQLMRDKEYSYYLNVALRELVAGHLRKGCVSSSPLRYKRKKNTNGDGRWLFKTLFEKETENEQKNTTLATKGSDTNDKETRSTKHDQ